jgi:hemerythrin-like domain-containing protein
MNAIDTLSNEHGLIRHYLGTLEQAAKKIEAGQNPPREFFDNAIKFARLFSDKYHHFKEELVVFVRLAQKSNGELDGQIDTLRHEHDRGRELVSGMAASLDGYAKGDARKTATLVENITAYVQLLRHHIHVEDHVCFPKAHEIMTEEELEAFEQEFTNARDRFGKDTFEVSHKQVIDMDSMLTHLG